MDSGEKSRRERRREVRLAKNKKKFDSWVQHQQSSKLRKGLLDSELKNKNKLESDSEVTEKKEVMSIIMDNVTEGDSNHRPPMVENSKIKLRVPKARNGKSQKSETKFSEYLEMEKEGGLISKEQDLRLERKLAKKLKVKNGKLGGVDDDINMLLDGIPSVLDPIDGDDAVAKSLESHDSDKPLKYSKYVFKDIENQMEPADMDGSSDSLDADSDEHDNAEKLSIPEDSKNKKRRKTKFEEYLEMEETQRGVFSAKEDFELERKLAKKLKVKEGKLRQDDDDIDKLLEGIPSALDSLEDAGSQGAEQDPLKSLDNRSSRKKRKMVKSEKQESKGQATIAILETLKNDDDRNVAETTKVGSALGGKTKYVAPHMRSPMQNEAEEHTQIRKRVRGLLNRLSESNVESIAGEVSSIFHSVGRSIGSQIIGKEILASCSGGPRGNEQYAATFAAFIAGMACLVGIDFGAKLLASLAKCFEKEYLEEDNLSLRNLTLLLSYLYIFGVCTSDLIYDFLIMLSKRLKEVDVSTILTILQSCGMKLRGDDPVGMKNFIDSVQRQVQELKAASENGQSNLSGKRMEFMFETICDIKNNKKRPKEDTVQHTRVKKWLQKLRVEDILIRGIKWSKLLDPDKKGQWWLSGDVGSATDNIEEVASKIHKEVPEAQKMLELAAAQRMNTDARRAIFCVIMSGEDYEDALAKLLSLDLPGKQDREIMRVIVECCLQEKVFNKYYCLLAHALCRRDKNHKFTLQYCLWDHFKELESIPLMRSMHLSKFVAEMVACFSLSLAILKVVDFGDPSQLTPKRIMHFRMLFEAIFEFSDKNIWNIFTRIAATPEYESLRNGIEFFISKYVISTQISLRAKFKIAKNALNNVEGILK